MLTRRQTLTLGASAAAAAVLPGTVFGQSAYPERPIEMIVPFAPGGGLDLFGRTVARVLSVEKLVKQTIQVTNMPGAGGALGMAEMVQRDDDAYSLCTLALHVHLTPLMQGTQHSYKDMTDIAKLYSEYDLMVVRAESPIKSLKDVTDALAKDVASISFGGATIGNSDHIAVCKLAQSVGADPTKLTYVAYSGGESNAAILGGHVDVGLGGHDLMDLVDGGKMRAIAVTASERLTGRMKDIPTFKEQGHDVVFQIWRGLFGPPHMPTEAVKFWEDSLATMVKSDAWKAELEKNMWYDAFDTGEHFRASLDAEHEDLRKLLQSVKLIK